ncbi:hypothetical protein FRC06_002865 [Ceratobasidium sp. 370]|nr:hypothetical protein FRC06_002865 [Ceratobasidium sp. 370]
MNEHTFSECLESFVLTIFEPSLQNLLQAQGKIRVRSEQTEREGAKEIASVIELQTAYIRRRIQAHASRVAAHQLAAAPLVIQDTQETMHKVWTLMPPGFNVGIEKDLRYVPGS